MAPWPRVIEGGGEEPRVIDEGLDDGIAYARPPALFAYGTVEGVPWRIQSSVTMPGPGGRWWEHGPVGPELLFMLGEDDAFGGGEVPTRLNEGTHLCASISFFGSKPEIVSWVGVVSDEVAMLVVDPDDGDAREVEIHDGPEGFLRIFWFFPPRGATGTLSAIANDGTALQTERLMDVDLPRDANAGTSVNPFGYREDEPRPGWPLDDTEFGPGEGPRHAEDFHLHEATFPLFAIPPDRWQGFAGLSGSSSSRRVVTGVRFGYFDEPGGQGRGFEIVNRRPKRRPWERRVGREDVGIWWSEPVADSDVLTFATRFLSSDERRAIHREPDTGLGPMRVPAIVEIELLGGRVEAQRRELRRFTSYRSIRFSLQDVEVLIQGWDLSFAALEGFARALEPLELGNDLFVSMQAAQARSDRRFDERSGRLQDGG